MSAEIFLACFLANLFAFVFVVVIGWQVAGYFIRKGIKKHLPEILAKALHGGTAVPHGMDENAMKEIVALMENAAKTPPGVIPHVGRVKCSCGTTEEVPLAENLEPYLKARGWRFEPTNYGWTCPRCAGVTFIATGSVRSASERLPPLKVVACAKCGEPATAGALIDVMHAPGDVRLEHRPGEACKSTWL